MIQAYWLELTYVGYVRQKSFETTSNKSVSLLSRIQLYLRKYLLTAQTLIYVQPVSV